MKIHKFTIFIADPNYEQDIRDLKVNIENGLNDQIVYFGEVQSKEIGEWKNNNFWNFSHKPQTLNKEFYKTLTKQ